MMASFGLQQHRLFVLRVPVQALVLAALCMSCACVHGSSLLASLDELPIPLSANASWGHRLVPAAGTQAATNLLEASRVTADLTNFTHQAADHNARVTDQSDDEARLRALLEGALLCNVPSSKGVSAINVRLCESATRTEVERNKSHQPVVMYTVAFSRRLTTNLANCRHMRVLLPIVVNADANSSHVTHAGVHTFHVKVHDLPDHNATATVIGNGIHAQTVGVDISHLIGEALLSRENPVQDPQSLFNLRVRVVSRRGCRAELDLSQPPRLVIVQSDLPFSTKPATTEAHQSNIPPPLRWTQYCSGACQRRDRHVDVAADVRHSHPGLRVAQEQVSVNLGRCQGSCTLSDIRACKVPASYLSANISLLSHDRGVPPLHKIGCMPRDVVGLVSLWIPYAMSSSTTDLYNDFGMALIPKGIVCRNHDSCWCE